MPNSDLRALVRGAYDLQALRIQAGGRLVSNFKARLGQAPSQSEEGLDAEAKQILKDIRGQYKKMTDGLKTFPRQKTFVGTALISSYTELCLISQYIDLEKNEDDGFHRLGNALKEHPIYTSFLKDVRGVGPAMAGVLIGEIDIHKAQYPSSLWKYAGLDVAQDGAGRSRRAAHLIKVPYRDKAGAEQEKNAITYNPFLKAKLIGVLSASFLWAGDNKYATLYYAYKHRLETDARHSEKSKGHRHHMALRYMIKMFLIDLYEAWRDLEKLPRRETYHTEKHGHQHAA